MLFIIVTLLSCSAKQNISNSAVSIKNDASEISSQSTKSNKELEKALTHKNEKGGLSQKAVPLIKKAKSRQNIIQGKSQSIKENVNSIHKNLQGVEDKVPWWANMLTWIAIAAVLVALIVLGYSTGLFSVFRPILGTIGSLLPTGDSRDASVDAKKIRSGEQSLQDEMIVRRAERSPTYEKRLQRELKKMEKEERKKKIKTLLKD